MVNIVDFKYLGNTDISEIISLLSLRNAYNPPGTKRELSANLGVVEVFPNKRRNIGGRQGEPRVL